MEKLFVIGNGFDLAHDLKTSYLNFKRFVYQQSYNSQVDVKLDKMSEIRNSFFYEFEIPSSTTGNHGEELYNDQEVAKKYYELISLIVKDKKDWSDFENSLANIGNIEFELNSFYDAEGDLDYSQSEKWLSFTEEKVRSLVSTNLSHYLVLEEDQKILGFARYLTDEVLTTFLAEIIIDKSHRRKGLGQQLIEEIHKKYPLTRIELISEADGFYRAISFKPVGTGFRKSE